jgi:tetraacyldisaccharide 4'-kinase
MGEIAYSLLPVLAQALAHALERGTFRGPVARTASRAWALAFEIGLANVIRPIALPHGVPAIAVGGATLGGSGKTPLAMACARFLAERGARVGLVGHAYRARPRGPRIVSLGDPLPEVGDDALLCARALAPFEGSGVVVAKRREQAIEFAARWADVLVLDGVLQTCPSPAALSLLAVDAEEPWGHTGLLPPCGDLRAPRAALLAACDLVVPQTDRTAGVWFGAPDGTERLAAWAEIRALKVGLLSASARPDRVLRSLRRNGVVPVRVIRARDHGPIVLPSSIGGGGAPPNHGNRETAEVWLATPKCSEHLRHAGCFPPRPPGRGLALTAREPEHVRRRPPTVGIIDHAFELSGALKERLEQAASP